MAGGRLGRFVYSSFYLPLSVVDQAVVFCRSGLSARSKLSDSDKSDSRAARGQESAATPPAPQHAGDSAGGTADSGAADMLQSLPHLEKKKNKNI